MSEVRGCPFIKIWFNGSIWNSFTEFYILRLPHIWGSPTIIDKNRCSDWAMQETLFDFLWFSKTDSDTTIEPNFDEMDGSNRQRAFEM